MFLTIGLFQLNLSPPENIAGEDAKVSVNASALSGDLILFFISSFDSSLSFPEELNEYLGVQSSFINSLSCGNLQFFFSNHSLALPYNSALKFA